MKRLPIFLLLVLTACSGTNLSTTSQKSFQKPNVLFIAVDDLRPELGAYGTEVIQTPNMDRLANEGALFTRAYVQQAVCNPSRASLMTGYRPDALRVWDLQTNFRTTTPDALTLPQHFKNEGYYTVAIGKIYHNIFPDTLSWSEPQMHVGGHPFDADAIYRTEDNKAIQEARKQRILASENPRRNIDQLGEWYLKASAYEAPDVPDNFYFDGIQTEVAIAKLVEMKRTQRPFFLGVGFFRPHLPFNAPKKYWDLYDPEEIPVATNPFLPEDAPLMAINNMRELRGYTNFSQVTHPKDGILSESEARTLKHGYYASVSYIDAQVGKLLDALETLGMADNTIVVLWGDHGWKLGEHASWAKMTNFEIDTRAPLIIKSPNPKHQKRQLNQLVEFVDIYPTLCELANLPLPNHLEGTSTVPLLENPERNWKPAVFSQFLREGIWIAPDGIPYMGYSIRTDQYRFTKWQNWDTKAFAGYELYDHKLDPEENKNLASEAAYQSILKTLEAQLNEGWKAALPE